jgi:hypothetical protein
MIFLSLLIRQVERNAFDSWSLALLMIQLLNFKTIYGLRGQS